MSEDFGGIWHSPETTPKQYKIVVVKTRIKQTSFCALFLRERYFAEYSLTLWDFDNYVTTDTSSIEKWAYLSDLEKAQGEK